MDLTALAAGDTVDRRVDRDTEPETVCVMRTTLTEERAETAEEDADVVELDSMTVDATAPPPSVVVVDFVTTTTLTIGVALSVVVARTVTTPALEGMVEPTVEVLCTLVATMLGDCATLAVVVV